MIYLKNKKTGQIGKFACPQGQYQIERKGKKTIKKWISDWEEATKTEIDNFELEKQKLKLINKRIQYLNSTDWYVIRTLDRIEIPDEIQQKRLDAREEINQIEKVSNLKDLKKYEV